MNNSWLATSTISQPIKSAHDDVNLCITITFKQVSKANMSSRTSSGSSGASSKSSFRKCPKCPHRLSNFHEHEPTPEPETGSETDMIADMPGLEDPVEPVNTLAAGQHQDPAPASGLTHQVEEQFKDTPETALLTTQGDVDNEQPPAYSDIVAEPEDYNSPNSSEPCHQTKAGKEHPKSCTSPCLHRTSRAEVRPVVTVEEVKEIDEAIEPRTNHFKIWEQIAQKWQLKDDLQSLETAGKKEGDGAFAAASTSTADQPKNCEAELQDWPSRKKADGGEETEAAGKSVAGSGDDHDGKERPAHVFQAGDPGRLE
jgi:hypothetical protein